MKFLKWSKDHWLSKHGNILVFDKLEHFLFSAVFVIGCVRFLGFDLYSTLALGQVFGVLKEASDGIRPYDGENIQGWSWKDLIANNAGFLVAWLILSL
jgi:hypothetical protein